MAVRGGAWHGGNNRDYFKHSNPPLDRCVKEIIYNLQQQKVAQSQEALSPENQSINGC
jgi:hypothetical protein